MLLAIDTSLGTSVAVVRHGRVLAERSEPDSRRHAEVVGEFILGVLTDADIGVDELTGVVVGMGPGPFTGLRVGIAAARAFAFGARIPIHPVVSHDGVALGRTGPLVVITDARRREIYWSAFGGSDSAGLPIRTAGPALAKPADLADASVGHPGDRVDVAEVSAGALGLLAELMLADGRDFATDEPLYLRSPDVTVSLGPKRVTA